MSFVMVPLLLILQIFPLIASPSSPSLNITSLGCNDKKYRCSHLMTSQHHCKNQLLYILFHMEFLDCDEETYNYFRERG